MEFTTKIKTLFSDKSLVRRIVFTVLALVVFRFLATIPIPGIDVSRLAAYFGGSQFLGLLDIFSGGGLSNLSIVMLGVGPYINASIIMQLVSMMIPSLKAMYQEEGDAGRKKFSQYTRLLALPLSVLQGFGFLMLLSKQGVIDLMVSTPEFWMNVLIVTAGSVLIMWLGELMTEFGIGNGTSLIIFAGIVAGIPTSFAQLITAGDVSQIPLYIAIGIVALLAIAGVVYVTEAQRQIPVTYAKRVRGNKSYGGVSTYLPLRLNQAGVIPIIFALSILLFPQMIAQFLANVANPVVQQIASVMTLISTNAWIHGVLYFILVFLFTYFYTAVTFDPVQLATNLQKNGAFIPGVRPGESTAQHISHILTRLTMIGALFLGFIAVLPAILQGVTGITTLSIGGTGLLIVISVVLDLLKKIDAQVSMSEY